MKAEPSPNTLLRPGPERWEAWVRTGRDKWSPTSEMAAQVSTLALPVHSLAAIPMTVQSTEPEIVEGLIRVHLETRGLNLQDPAQSMVTYWTVAEQDTEIQILAVVLLDPSIDAVGAKASTFNASPAFVDPPENGILLWKELGHWVVLFTRGKRVAHFQTLSQMELNAEAGREIQTIRDGLEFQGYLEDLREVLVRVETLEDASKDALQDTLELPVRWLTQEGVISPGEPSRLVPGAVAQERRRHQLRRRIILGAAGLLAIYVLFMGSWIARLVWMESKAARISAQVNQIDDVASQVREARIQVQQLGPAIDYETFPLELFHRCVELLPEEGIRLTYFKISPGKVELRGEASDFTAAISWKAKLRGSDVFGEYDWEFPQPELLPDDRAIFTATGTIPEEEDEL